MLQVPARSMGASKSKAIAPYSKTGKKKPGRAQLERSARAYFFFVCISSFSRLSPIIMLGFVIFLLFLLGWPFEWPAIILVFLPIFFPVVDALKPALSQQLGIPPDLFMVWFGSLVAVTMQTAYLSPPVAMSAYYLKQVVKEWSLGTIYKGMFEFMVLQCIAIAVVMFVPQIATSLPEHLQKEARAAPVEDVDDSMNKLEEDPYKEQQNTDELEKDELSTPQKK